tara:strand:- start:489 stop:647 length:159 start_codon:yes stop_codon:yes gene_type:complete
MRRNTEVGSQSQAEFIGPLLSGKGSWQIRALNSRLQADTSAKDLLSNSQQNS